MKRWKCDGVDTYEVPWTVHVLSDSPPTEAEIKTERMRPQTDQAAGGDRWDDAELIDVCFKTTSIAPKQEGADGCV